MQTSLSGFVIYDSMGNLLKGTEPSEKYRELALDINTKRSALYFESNEGRVIFGCCLRVKKEEAQEETLVFIQVFDQIVYGIKKIHEFYDKACLEIERLGSKKYTIIGLWEKGDLNNIKKMDVPKKVLVYIAGKIIAGEKVSIQTSDVNIAVNLIVNVIIRLKSALFSNFVFIASEYPSKSDISISLNETKPEIIFDPDLNSKISKCAYKYYSLLYFTFKKRGKEFNSRESLAFEIQKEAMAENENTLINSFYSCNALPNLFRIYDGNIEILKSMAFNLIQKNHTEILLPVLINNPELTKKLMPELIKEIVNSKEMCSFAKKLYEQCENNEIKAYLEILYYIKYPCSPMDCTFYNTIQRSLIISAINTRKLRYFNALQEPVKNLADSKKITKNAVQDMNDLKLVDFVRFVIEMGEKPVNGTKTLLDQIFSRWLSIGSISYLFSSDELNKLDLLMGSNYAEQSENKYIENATNLRKKISPSVESYSVPYTTSNLSKNQGNEQKKKEILLIGALAFTGLILILIAGACLLLSPVDSTYPCADFTVKTLSNDSYFCEEKNTVYAFTPFSAQFNDTSENAVSVEWNFGDENKSWNRNLEHTYFTAGNYNLSLTASNENGTDTIEMFIHLIEGHQSSKNIEEYVGNKNISSVAP